MGHKIITWLDDDGNYRSTTPAYNDKASPADRTDEQLIEIVLTKIRNHFSLADDHEFHIVEDSEYLAKVTELEGSEFRYGGVDTGHSGAWEMDTDGRPKIDMPKARIVHMDHIREARNVEIEKLDIPYMRAVEAADTEEQASISTQKQTLRDIPTTFDLEGFTTPATLKNAWPDELEGAK
jgi:hypothetical protein